MSQALHGICHVGLIGLGLPGVPINSNASGKFQGLSLLLKERELSSWLVLCTLVKTGALPPVKVITTCLLGGPPLSRLNKRAYFARQHTLHLYVYGQANG